MNQESKKVNTIPDNYHFYDLCLRLSGVVVDRRTNELLYDMAMLVKKKKGKANLKDMVAVECEVDRRNPLIVQWSKPTHRENHMI